MRVAQQYDIVPVLEYPKGSPNAKAIVNDIFINEDGKVMVWLVNGNMPF